MRADARGNRDRLLDAAAAAFSRDGADASLKAISEEAGVGIGTLYRRFPTREALYVAVHRAEIEQVAARADVLLGELPPREALAAWVGEFVAFLRAKQGMAEVFRTVMADGANPFLDLRVLATEAAERLLTAGRRHGVRQDVDAFDLLTTLHGITLASTDPAQTERLVGLVLAGVVSRRR